MADTWTIGRALEWTRAYLEQHGDDHARLSAEWLLGAACALSRIEVYTSFERPLTEAERTCLRENLTRRAAGEPLQYILGEAAFRTLTLKTVPDTLIPRPETEVLVDLALELLDELTIVTPATPTLIADLCTGGGCVGLSLAQERAGLRVLATDLSPRAVALANENARDLGLDARYTALTGDLFDPLPPETFQLIVANPPYLPTDTLDRLPKEVRAFEPLLALDGGDDGLDIARRILRASPDRLSGSGGVLMELDPRNVSKAARFAVELDRYDLVRVASDLSGRERFLVARTGSVEGVQVRNDRGLKER